MRDTGEPAIIAGLTESLRDQYAIPKDRVFVAGLSAGGAMAAIMGETYPELYGAIGVHSGLAYGSANDVCRPSRRCVGKLGIEQVPSRNGGGGSEAGPRMIVFHGSADTTVHPSNAGRIIASQEGVEAPKPSTDRRVRPGRIRASSRSGTTARTGSSAGWSTGLSMPGPVEARVAPTPIRAALTRRRRWSPLFLNGSTEVV